MNEANKSRLEVAVESLNKFGNEQFLGYFGGSHPHRLHYTIEYGRKWTKIVKEDKNAETGELLGSRSIYCFIDDDLNIWKAASWKKPATNKIRGHVNDFNDEKNFITGKIQWTGF